MTMWMVWAEADGGPEEGIGEGERGSASWTQRANPRIFARNMAQLRTIMAVYSFPVKEPYFKEGTYGRPKIHVTGRHCTSCLGPYDELPDADAILLTQVMLLGLLCVSSDVRRRRHCSTKYRITAGLDDEIRGECGCDDLGANDPPSLCYRRETATHVEYGQGYFIGSVYGPAESYWLLQPLLMVAHKIDDPTVEYSFRLLARGNPRVTSHIMNTEA